MFLWAHIVKPIFLQIHYTFINEQYLYKYLSMQQACWFQNAFFRETSKMQRDESYQHWRFEINTLLMRWCINFFDQTPASIFCPEGEKKSDDSRKKNFKLRDEGER